MKPAIHTSNSDPNHEASRPRPPRVNGLIANPCRHMDVIFQESENIFFKAFRASPSALSISDIEQQRFIEVNDAYLEMFGYTREEFLRNSSTTLGLWDNDEERRQVLDAFFARGSLRSMEVVGRAKNGERIVCLLSAESIEIAGRNCVVATVHDITTLRRAEKERESLQAQLLQAQKMESIGNLAGGIAHDFNNILAAIVAYNELADMEPALPQSVRGCLAQIREASARAKDLVGHILSFSRHDRQGRRPTRLQPVIEEALKLMRSTLPSTIEIDARILSDALPVLADPTQIYQVVLNLCINAAQAMRGNPGKLTIVYDVCREDAIVARNVLDPRPGEYTRLTVADTGSGMEPEVLERIFEPFFTTKAPGEGTGLGLPVAHRIVREHGGAIAVRSTPGLGTTFDIYLPVVEVEPDESPADPAPWPRGRGEQVLIVDDEQAVRDSMCMLLEHLGYTATAHADPMEALRQFAEEPKKFSLVIADLTMPRVTGIEFARRILRLQPRLPILLATGFAGALTREQVRDLGIYTLLAKPTAVSKLAETIRAALDGIPPRQNDND